MAGGSRRSLFLVILVLLLCGALGAVFGQRMSPGTSDAQVKGDLQQFSTVYSVVEQNYADSVDPDKAIYDGAIPGMLRVLDPHSNFFDPKAYGLLRRNSAASTTAWA